jgi:hypothetical protein
MIAKINPPTRPPTMLSGVPQDANEIKAPNIVPIKRINPFTFNGFVSLIWFSIF